tara:strand:- start:1272 stop:1727 length:456 start_codon:yes stop_codon:yes gene_type:complete
MAISITTAMPTSFKVELFQAVHNFTASTGDTFKVALFKELAASSSTFGVGTTNYSDMGADELPSAGGYTAGGNTLVSITPVAAGSTAVCNFANTTWGAATFVTCGALIYNSSKGNKAVAVLSFGGDQQVSSGNFQILFPAATASTAIIRVA